MAVRRAGDGDYDSEAPRMTASARAGAKPDGCP